MGSIDERRVQLQEVSRGALAELTNLLDAKTIDLVGDFIDNFEFGVALDWMCSALEEKTQAVTTEQRRRLQELAEALGVTLPIRVQRS